MLGTRDIKETSGTILAKIDDVNETVKSMAGALAELIERRKVLPIGELSDIVGLSFEGLPEIELYEALHGGSYPLKPEPSFVGLTSSVCRQIHFSLDEFRYWTRAMGRYPRMHRKEWEWFYISQALFERGLLQPGRRGLVFAVGQEPLPSLFARYGCDILATDQAPDSAAASGWASSGMYSAHADALHHASVVHRAAFDARVRFEHADMNDVPARFNDQFDFCWSSCAFEHLGSLEHGLRFVQKSIDTLVPGGIAVHTTEFNLSSNDDTWETIGSALFRRRDIEDLIARLEADGHSVEPVIWDIGRGMAETVVDRPPYRQSPHLTLNIVGYDCTSIGLIIRRGGGADAMPAEPPIASSVAFAIPQPASVIRPLTPIRRAKPLPKPEPHFQGQNYQELNQLQAADEFELARMIRATMQLLRPQHTPDYPKVRIGSGCDGAYVMLDDFHGIDTALSFGINDNIEWDKVIADKGIHVYQFDHTVDDPAPLDNRMTFQRKMIMPMASDTAESIESLVRQHDKRNDRPNLILKMDIEDWEWPVLEATSLDTLARFSQITCELHRLNYLTELADRQIIFKGLRKLSKLFAPVHVHANNYAGWSFNCNVPVPAVMEVTYVNRSLYDLRDSEEIFPTELDQACDPHRPDLFLGRFQY